MNVFVSTIKKNEHFLSENPLLLNHFLSSSKKTNGYELVKEVQNNEEISKNIVVRSFMMIEHHTTRFYKCLSVSLDVIIQQTAILYITAHE